MTVAIQGIPLAYSGQKQEKWTRLDRFFGLCLMVILYNVVVLITYEAAAPSGAQEALLQTVAAGADGDSTRQILYLMIFLLVTGVALWARGQKILTAIPLPYNLACFWCLFSFVWAIEPGISIRRSIGMYIILQATCIAVQALGTQKTLRVLYLFLAGVLTTSLVSIALSSIPLFSFAVHPANETDASLIGAWRGVLPHKNVAGAMMTHASIVFLHFALNRKKLIDWMFFFGTILFLIGTKSKTSLGLAGIVLAAGVIYRYVVSQRGGNSAFGVLLLCLVLSLGVLGIGANEKIAAYLSDPESFSGRVAIWSSLLTYIKSHIWLGSGYGSFWAIGYDSPIYAIATTSFIREIGHSHSGYFEILLSTGVIGLVLAVYSLVVWPLVRFLRARPRDARLFGMCFSIWLFGILQNMTESQFFSPDKQSWVFVVISICLVHNVSIRAQGSHARLAPPHRQGASIEARS
jgi:exopolysaccharide production protein ExoQ